MVFLGRTMEKGVIRESPKGWHWTEDLSEIMDQTMQFSRERMFPAKGMAEKKNP